MILRGQVHHPTRAASPVCSFSRGGRGRPPSALPRALFRRDPSPADVKSILYSPLPSSQYYLSTQLTALPHGDENNLFLFFSYVFSKRLPTNVFGHTKPQKKRLLYICQACRWRHRHIPKTERNKFDLCVNKGRRRKRKQ